MGDVAAAELSPRRWTSLAAGGRGTDQPSQAPSHNLRSKFLSVHSAPTIRLHLMSAFIARDYQTMAFLYLQGPEM